MATPIPSNRARLTLTEVAAATRGTIAKRVAEEGAGITSDSRAVTPGGIFVALRGENHDGHAFVAMAIERGASIVVLERAHEAREVGSVSVVLVDDTLVAWGDLARAHLVRWRSAGPDRRVVAITGSAGKTTTKELTAALLAEVAPTHFTAGNLNNRVGVPAVVFALEAGHQFCVLEVGMSVPGEIDAIAGFVRPDVSVIVNVGVAHAEGVGGLDGVMHEKGGVYRALGDHGIAIVNADDPYVRRAATEGAVKHSETFGRGSEDSIPTYRLVDRVPIATGSRVTLSCTRAGFVRDITVELALPGEAAAIDLAAALAAEEAASGRVLGVSAIERALGRITIEGRGTVRHLRDDVLVLDDTYNANPASMRAALATLAEIAGERRRVAVLGEMKELGALGPDEHRSLGDAVADAGVSLAIGCGGLVELALDRAAAMGVEVVRAKDADAAAAETLKRTRPGDAILVKGSRGVRAEKVIEALLRR